MPLPIVAVVGRPNVGKSTFVNRIVQDDEAIVHSASGVTRDRSYHNADWNGVEFKLVDTGGIEMGNSDSFQGSIRNQALEATYEADLIIFIVDGKSGVTSDDVEVAHILQRSDKPVFLVANKIDNPFSEDESWDFFQLGLGNVWSVSALHGSGTGDLLDELVKKIRELDLGGQDDIEGAISIAIIGKPNAGKSSLANKMLDMDRSIVSNIAGTTRDAIDTYITRNNQIYRIIDTAGLKRKGQLDVDVEYYGFVRAMRAIDRADVAVLVIDADCGLTDQDQRVADFAQQRGCAMVIVLNKWDLLLDSDAKSEIRERVHDRLMFVGYAPVIAISALTGKNVGCVWDKIDEVYANYNSKVQTSRLNAWLADIRESGHTVTKGKRILRMKYATQISTCPPKFSIFVNHPDIVNDNYKRFLENSLRKTIDLSGTPIYFKFKRKD